MKTKAAKRRQRVKKRSRKKAIQPSNIEKDPQTAKPNDVPNTRYNSATNVSAMWRGVYESLIFRQCDVQIEYWKQRAKRLEEENEQLRLQLRATEIPAYETSSEEDDDVQERYLNGEGEEYDDDDISPEYMEFRTITLKHREDLRKQREEESLKNNVCFHG
ncbi:uncharacterized protein [Eurosta solidaginis]|uniref:uncharacterized protein n=1 Tax=Eurosta solidaginis TaxID=178769 RepID=UPI00353124AB